MNKRIAIFVMLSGTVAVSCKNEPSQSALPFEVEVAKCIDHAEAAVACAHPEAARMGAEILAKGGNAIDASIAIQWALAVCYPEAGNIGGGGLMVARMSDGSAYTLDFRESAPATAHRDFYLDESGAVLEGKSTTTHYAAGIPGTVHGLYTAHERFGSMPMDSLISPAIRLAAKGFPLTAIQANNLNRHRNSFAELNKGVTAFLNNDGNWQAGDTLRQPELASTLERIRINGAAEFYQGETAQMMIDEMPADVPWFGAEDLSSYRAVWREPVQCAFDSVNVISMPPPSSGGIALCQLLELFHLSQADTLAHNSADYIHHLVEMERRVYADRAEHLGDPDYFDVPQEGLLKSGYLKRRWADFDPLKATPSALVAAGSPTYESMETTHLSVVDKDGNAVAVTTTLNDIYGSKIVVTGAGFLLNNEMDDFSTKPGEANMYGLIGGEANAVGPRKRMLSSMTPTIVEVNGALYLVAGSPGGSTIITSVFQTVLNAVYHQMPLDETISAAKFHSQWLPDEITIEAGRFDSLTVDSLRRMGHSIATRSSLGRVDAILVLPNGSLSACGDNRSDNSAGAYKK